MSKKLFLQIIFLIVIFCVAMAVTKIGVKRMVCAKYSKKCPIMSQKPAK